MGQIKIQTFKISDGMETMNHPDNPLNDYPIRDTDLSQSFEKLKSYIKEEEKLKKEPIFQSRNKLEFEVAKGNEFELEDGWLRFRIGTCAGMWRSTDDAYEILAISNDVPGNTHLNDVFDWFENSCKRDKKNFRIREVWNQKFKTHLIEKRGFNIEGQNDVIKIFLTSPK